MPNTIQRRRVLTANDLRERIERIKYRLNQPHGDSFSGWAEMLSYELEDYREKLTAVLAGETVAEVYDSYIGRWQDE